MRNTDYAQHGLDAQRVKLIRISGYTDAYWARRLHMPVRTIRNARTGITWAWHPTPPDTAPREGDGRKASIHARPARKRRAPSADEVRNG